MCPGASPIGFALQAAGQYLFSKKAGGKLGLDPLAKKKAVKFPKKPKPDEPGITTAQQHIKEKQLAAYGVSDTYLTAGGGKGLGSFSMPSYNLWKSLGSG